MTSHITSVNVENFVNYKLSVSQLAKYIDKILNRIFFTAAFSSEYVATYSGKTIFYTSS